MSAEGRRLLGRYSWLFRVRPQPLAAALRRLLVGPGRFIVETSEGARFHVDPLNFLGRCLLEEGAYEPETVAIVRRCLEPGDLVWDVGANEGYISVLAARAVGPEGRVVAIEPQTRLHDVIEINAALNRLDNVTLVRAAMSGSSSDVLRLNLGTSLNSGSSSLVKHYRWSSNSEDVASVTPGDLLALSPGKRVSLVKVDVEGYEGVVVRAMLPLLREGTIRRLLLDYHPAHLAERGETPAAIHASLLGVGAAAVTPFSTEGYVLYDAGAVASGAA